MAILLTKSYQKICEVETSIYTILRLYGKYNSQNNTDASSNTTFQARLYGNGGGGSFDSGTIAINGVEYNLSDISYTKGNETVLATLTYDIAHNNDGTIELDVSAILESSHTPNGTCTGTITLPPIPRYANFTSHSINKVSQTGIEMSWSADTDCDLVEYSLNNGEWITASETTDSTYRITNLLSGAGYSVRTRIRHAGSGLYTISDSLSTVTKRLKAKYNNDGTWKDVAFYAHTGDAYNKTLPYINVDEIWNHTLE